MNEAISCHDAVRRFWDYIDDDIDAADRERIDAHLTFCLRCCGEMEFARELRGVLATRTLTTIPEPARERLEGLIDRVDELTDFDEHSDLDEHSDEPRT